MRPLRRSSTTSSLVHSTLSMPRSAARGPAWKFVAEEASATVWPFRWWAFTIARASG